MPVQPSNRRAGTAKTTSKPASPKPIGPGRPKDLNKRAAILDVAKRLFLAAGFDGVSMDQIAAEAGVSKLTVYSHFGDKDSLFSAAIRSKCEEQLPSTLFLPTLEGSLRERLTAIARAFFALVTSDDALSTHRMMTTPGNGDLHVRELFWQAGPQRVKDAFAELLRGYIARGEVDVADVDRAASQFFCLIKGDLHMRMLCGMCGQPDSDEIDAHVAATVDLFLRAYARDEGPGA
jgi:TetR/AcrR family transcriptional regulator, mexJK operon transcriptional repressor